MWTLLRSTATQKDHAYSSGGTWHTSTCTGKAQGVLTSAITKLYQHSLKSTRTVSNRSAQNSAHLDCSRSREFIQARREAFLSSTTTRRMQCSPGLPGQVSPHRRQARSVSRFECATVDHLKVAQAHCRHQKISRCGSRELTGTLIRTSDRTML